MQSGKDAKPQSRQDFTAEKQRDRDAERARFNAKLQNRKEQVVGAHSCAPAARIVSTGNARMGRAASRDALR
jgi:hypothetical protein